jgi:hypothetical protein
MKGVRLDRGYGAFYPDAILDKIVDNSVRETRAVLAGGGETIVISDLSVQNQELFRDRCMTLALCWRKGRTKEG